MARGINCKCNGCEFDFYLRNDLFSFLRFGRHYKKNLSRIPSVNNILSTSYCHMKIGWRVYMCVCVGCIFFIFHVLSSIPTRKNSYILHYFRSSTLVARLHWWVPPHNTYVARIGQKVSNECPNTRFPLSTLLRRKMCEAAEYSKTLQRSWYFVL